MQRSGTDSGRFPFKLMRAYYYFGFAGLFWTI
jgi:hypothetical protein